MKFSVRFMMNWRIPNRFIKIYFLIEKWDRLLINLNRSTYMKFLISESWIDVLPEFGEFLMIGHEIHGTGTTNPDRPNLTISFIFQECSIMLGFEAAKNNMKKRGNKKINYHTSLTYNWIFWWLYVSMKSWRVFGKIFFQEYSKNFLIKFHVIH